MSSAKPLDAVPMQTGRGGRNEKCDWATIQDFKGHILDAIYLAIFPLFDPANKVTQNNDSTDNSASPASRWGPLVVRNALYPLLLRLFYFWKTNITATLRHWSQRCSIENKSTNKMTFWCV